MAHPPRLTLIWLISLMIAVIINVESAGYVDKNGNPAPKPCKEGEEYYFNPLVYTCQKGKMEYSGCKMNNKQYRKNEIKDLNNLRHQYCIKTGNRIRSAIIGCVTDDGKFLDSDATVTQKNGVTFQCIQRGNGFVVQKTTKISVAPAQCELGTEKVLSDRYVLKCQKTQNGTHKFQLHSCLSIPGKRDSAFPVGQTTRQYMDKDKISGFVFKCAVEGHRFTYHPVACLFQSTEIAEGQTHKIGNSEVMCYNEGDGKLKLRAVSESSPKMNICKKDRIYNRGNLRFRCVSGAYPVAIACVNNDGKQIIQVGEIFKTNGAFKYVCQQSAGGSGLILYKLACLDENNKEIKENTVHYANDGSKIKCFRNKKTGDLERIFISMQNAPCKAGSKPMTINNIQYVCNAKAGYYFPEACVSFDQPPQIIPIGNAFNSKYYSYICKRKENEEEIVYHAVHCFDDAKNVIQPGTEKKSGNKVYKCIVKNEYDLSLVISEAGGCSNPRNTKQLRAGSVLRKLRKIGSLKYKIAYKCVKVNGVEAIFEWVPLGIEVGGQKYAQSLEVIIINGQKYKIVATGGNDITLVAVNDYEINCYVNKITYKHNETFLSSNKASVFHCLKGKVKKISCRLDKDNKIHFIKPGQVGYISKVPYYCSNSSDDIVILPFDGCTYQNKTYKLNTEFNYKDVVYKCTFRQVNGTYEANVLVIGCLHNGKSIPIGSYIKESKYLVCKTSSKFETKVFTATSEEVNCIKTTNTYDCAPKLASSHFVIQNTESGGLEYGLTQQEKEEAYGPSATNDTEQGMETAAFGLGNGVDSGLECSKNGTKVRKGSIIEICHEKRMVYYGCYVNGREHREGEIVDKKHLRSKYCVKKGNMIISSVIGCITDDGIFLQGHQNVTQTDGAVFVCIPHIVKGKQIGYRYTKTITAAVKAVCHPGDRKVLRNMYVLECRHSETTIGVFEYTLAGCLTKPGDLSTIINVTQTHDDFFDDSDFGFRYACNIRKRGKDVPAVYTYEPIACLSGTTIIKPGKTFDSASLSIMCYREGRFLRLKPVYAGLSTELCTNNKVFYLGNFKYQCKKGKEKRAIACLSFKNNTEVKIGEYYDEPYTYRYQCQYSANDGYISFTKTHCLDDNNKPMDPGSRKVLNDDSAILCRYDQNTDQLSRISISGRIHKCNPKKDGIFVKNYIAYKCAKSVTSESTTSVTTITEGRYKPIGCAPENDATNVIGYGKYHNSQFYRYLCEKKDDYTVIYRAVVCLDGRGHVIKPQFRERFGDYVFKCNKKVSGSLELKIYNPRGCMNPFKNTTLLKPGAVVKEAGKIQGIVYEKRFKCVRAGTYFELISEGIYFEGHRYSRPGQVVIEKNGGKLIIVQISGGGYSIQWLRDDQLRCYYNDKVYNNTAHFIAPSGNSIYHCINGEIMKIACKIGNHQVRVGQTLEIDNQIYQCPHVSEGYVKIPISGCHLKNGTTIPFGQSFIDKHIVYRCSYQGIGSEYRAVVIAVGCIKNDQVIPINGYREVVRGRKQFFICRLGYDEGPMIMTSSEMETDCITTTGKVDCGDTDEWGTYLKRTITGESSNSYVIEGYDEESICGDSYYIDSIPDYERITIAPLHGGENDTTFTVPFDTGSVTPDEFTLPFTSTTTTGFETTGTTRSLITKELETTGTTELSTTSGFETTGTTDSSTSTSTTELTVPTFVTPTIECDPTTVAPIPTTSDEYIATDHTYSTQTATVVASTGVTGAGTPGEFKLEEESTTSKSSTTSRVTESTTDYASSTGTSQATGVTGSTSGSTASSSSTSGNTATTADFTESTTDYISSRPSSSTGTSRIVSTSQSSMSTTVEGTSEQSTSSTGATHVVTDSATPVTEIPNTHSTGVSNSGVTGTGSIVEVTPPDEMDRVNTKSTNSVPTTGSHSTGTTEEVSSGSSTTSTSSGAPSTFETGSTGSSISTGTSSTGAPTTFGTTPTESTNSVSTTGSHSTGNTEEGSSTSSYSVGTDSTTAKHTRPSTPGSSASSTTTTSRTTGTSSTGTPTTIGTGSTGRSSTFAETSQTPSSTGYSTGGTETTENPTSTSSYGVTSETLEMRIRNATEVSSSTTSQSSTTDSTSFSTQTAPDFTSSTGSSATTTTKRTVPTTVSESFTSSTAYSTSSSSFSSSSLSETETTVSGPQSTTKAETPASKTTSSSYQTSQSTARSAATVSSTYEMVSTTGIGEQTTGSTGVTTPYATSRSTGYSSVGTTSYGPDSTTGTTGSTSDTPASTTPIQQTLSPAALRMTNDSGTTSEYSTSESSSTVTVASSTSHGTRETRGSDSTTGNTQPGYSSSYSTSGNTESTSGYTLTTDETTPGSPTTSDGTRSSDYSTYSTGRTRPSRVTPSRSTESTRVTGFEATPATGSSHSTDASTQETVTLTETTSDGIFTTESVTATTGLSSAFTRRDITLPSPYTNGTGNRCIDLVPKELCVKFLPICSLHAIKRNIAYSLNQKDGRATASDLHRFDRIQNANQFKSFAKEMEKKSLISKATLSNFLTYATTITSQPQNVNKNDNSNCGIYQKQCNDNNNQESCLLHDERCFTGIDSICLTENSCEQSINYHRQETAEFLTRLCPVTCGLQTCYVMRSANYDINEIDGFVDALRSCR